MKPTYPEITVIVTAQSLDITVAMDIADQMEQRGYSDPAINKVVESVQGNFETEEEWMANLQRWVTVKTPPAH